MLVLKQNHHSYKTNDWLETPARAHQLFQSFKITFKSPDFSESLSSIPSKNSRKDHTILKPTSPSNKRCDPHCSRMHTLCQISREACKLDLLWPCVNAKRVWVFQTAHIQELFTPRTLKLRKNKFKLCLTMRAGRFQRRDHSGLRDVRTNHARLPLPKMKQCTLNNSSTPFVFVLQVPMLININVKDLDVGCES